MTGASADTEDWAAKTLTDADLLVLGLLAEMPRHGYELEQVIDDRGMREWTEIGFSSIYFVLNKLERLKLVKAGKTSGVKARKRYSLTEAGTKAVKAHSVKALVRPSEWTPVGLVPVDFKTQKRTPKLSAKWFQEAARRNAVV